MSENTQLAVMPLKDYKDACDTIRVLLDSTDIIKSNELPRNIQNVHTAGSDVGYEIGFAEGKTDGIEIGKQTENTQFWTNFLSGLNKEDYRYAMAGNGWNDNSFNPNVSFTAAQGSNMSGFFYYNATKDVAGILERNDVVWDFSGALNVSNFAYNSKIVNFPLLDFSNVTNMYRAFYGLKGSNTTLPLKINDDGSQVFDDTFNGARGIVNLTIYGTIGQNGFNVSPCINLSKDSWISIINALSSTTSGLSITGSLASVQKAFETSEGANDGDTSPEWEALEATKTNWTINLI